MHSSLRASTISPETEQPSVRLHIFKSFQIDLLLAHRASSLLKEIKRMNGHFLHRRKFHLSEIHRSLDSLWAPAFVQMSLLSRSLHLLFSRALYCGF